MSANTVKIGENLLAWYDRHARQLPWRIGPDAHRKGTKADPYRVWLSEIMLQQTTVATVKDYYAKFTQRWPEVEALADASEDDILKAWAGLGYYSRARNLKRCADVVVEQYGGQFPAGVDQLRALPGIGDYTAAAIASIAYDVPAPVVDGNVERVFTRLFAIETPLPKAKAEIKDKVRVVLPMQRPGDFAQACMDLGATICTPKRPACMHCPVRSHCAVLGTRDPERFPVKAPKKEKPQRVGAAYVIENERGEILLEKRKSSGLLANMAQVPTSSWDSRRDGQTGTDASPVPDAKWRNCGSIDHVFTHFSLTLTVWKVETVKDSFGQKDGQWWAPLSEVDGEALPTVMKKAIACAFRNAKAAGVA